MFSLRSCAGVSFLLTALSLNPYDRGVVQRVSARAAARLEEPECVKVLTDFKDRRGRTLEANLQPLGVSASRYMRELTFLDGSAQAACRAPSVIMAATPGVRRVVVGPSGPGRISSRLSRLEFLLTALSLNPYDRGVVQRVSGSLAEAMVIHEMLHTLGLGENPPTTTEITARVRDRCR
jgi:hypothetical protein